MREKKQTEKERQKEPISFRLPNTDKHSIYTHMKMERRISQLDKHEKVKYKVRLIH